MKRNDILKILSVLLAFLLTINADCNVCVADDNLTSEEERIVLEQRLKQVNSRLSYLEKQSGSTIEYVNALNERLGYLKEQYTIVEKECADTQAQIDSTVIRANNNRLAIKEADKRIKDLDTSLNELSTSFEQAYTQYAKRLRAMYVSGNNKTYLEFLLDSDGVASFLVRLEMFMRVTRADSEMLASITSKTKHIIELREDMNKENSQREENKTQLQINEISLKNQRGALYQNEETLKAQRIEIENEQEKANSALKELNDKTQKYGEYRDITQEEIAKIDSEIESGNQKYPQVNPPASENTTSQNEESTTKQNEYISLIYPCPSHTEITCGFGEYKGHSGCDFSTKHKENETIVASESGTVILVRLLEKSYGHYVVIRHDKTTSDGKEVYTLYAHNNDIIVSEGDYVNKGQQIAYSGTTGNSTGPHCHFEVRVGGSSQACAKNPSDFLPNGSG